MKLSAALVISSALIAVGVAKADDREQCIAQCGAAYTDCMERAGTSIPAQNQCKDAQQQCANNCDNRNSASLLSPGENLDSATLPLASAAIDRSCSTDCRERSSKN
jgi:hypothetical protein